MLGVNVRIRFLKEVRIRFLKEVACGPIHATLCSLYQIPDKKKLSGDEEFVSSDTMFVHHGIYMGYKV